MISPGYIHSFLGSTRFPKPNCPSHCAPALFKAAAARSQHSPLPTRLPRLFFTNDWTFLFTGGISSHVNENRKNAVQNKSAGLIPDGYTPQVSKPSRSLQAISC